MSFFKKAAAFSKNIHFQSLLGNGVMSVFGLITLTILYRSLSIKDNGIYVLFLSMMGLIDAIRFGFLTNSFIKFYSGTQKDRAHEVTGSAWCIGLFITVGIITLGLVASLFSSHIHSDGVLLLLKYLPWMFLSTLPNFMGGLIAQGDKRFDRLLWLKSISQISFCLSVFILAILHKATLDSVVTASILTNVASSLVALMLNWARIGTIVNFSKKTIAEIFHFGKYSMGTSLSSTLFKVTDVFIINYFLGPIALAVYNLGGKLLLFIEVPLTSFAASGMPSMSSYYNNNRKEEMMLFMKKMVGMVSIVIFLIAIVSIIFANPIILLIGGKKLVGSEAANLFRIFMTIAILYPADRLFAVTLDVISTLR